jgi:hypothetical protein
MKTAKSFSIENIPLVWMTLGCLVLCAGILMGAIAIGRIFLKDGSGPVALAPSAMTAQAETVSYPVSSGSYSSDSASLIP